MKTKENTCIRLQVVVIFFQEREDAPWKTKQSHRCI